VRGRERGRHPTPRDKERERGREREKEREREGERERGGERWKREFSPGGNVCASL